MVTRTVSFAEGEFYHVYNRGVDKRDIFLDHADYQRFQELLFLSNSAQAINVRDIKKYHDPVYGYKKDKEQVAIGAYCLMPNHFHILLTPHKDNGVSIFMNKLTTSYSMYFNKKYDRNGTLFQGRFKAQIADSDEYLKYLFAYIHLNPVKMIDPKWKDTKITDLNATWNYLQSYRYSSLPSYLNRQSIGSSIINPSPFPEYFTTASAHKEELFEWLDFDTEIGHPRKS